MEECEALKCVQKFCCTAQRKKNLRVLGGYLRSIPYSDWDMRKTGLSLDRFTAMLFNICRLGRNSQSKLSATLNRKVLSCAYYMTPEEHNIGPF